MPDLVTHGLSGVVLKRVGNRRISLALVLFGSLLPDLISWLPLNLYFHLERLWNLPPTLQRFFPPMHSPLLVVLVCALMAELFTSAYRRLAFESLVAGSLLHVLLDLLQWKYDGGYLVFYPLSLTRHQIGLVDQQYWYFWLALVLGIGLLLEAARFLMGRKGRGR